MNDPMSRLEVVQREIDRVFGDGHAAANSQLVAAVLAAAAQHIQTSFRDGVYLFQRLDRHRRNQ
jgi:hypothetical protein